MRRLRASALSSMAWACCCSEAAGIRNYLTISDWWGRQDSNLRSHEAADLQSAPFATRDTPPLDGIAIRFAWRRRRIGHGEVRTATTLSKGSRSGAFMVEPPWQSQPSESGNCGEACPNCHCSEPVTQALP